MKKILYFALLAAELFVGVLLMIALCQSALYIPVAVAAVAVVAVVVWQAVALTKATDAVDRRNILFKIAVAMLIPVAVYMITFVVIAIGFLFAFA